MPGRTSSRPSLVNITADTTIAADAASNLGPVEIYGNWRVVFVRPLAV